MVGFQTLSNADLISLIIGTKQKGDNGDRLARQMMNNHGGLIGLARATPDELLAYNGVGPVTSGRIRASFEIGKRILTPSLLVRPRVVSPTEAANLLMAEMSVLEQEQLRVILMDTRNRVLRIPTIYLGSLNTSVVRVGEMT